MADTVKVTSALENRIQLRLYELVDGEHVSFSQNPTGTPTARRKGDAVTVTPGENEIDAGFWREWVKQNEGGNLLVSRSLVEKTEQERACDGNQDKNSGSGDDGAGSPEAGRQQP